MPISDHVRTRMAERWGTDQQIAALSARLAANEVPQ